MPHYFPENKRCSDIIVISLEVPNCNIKPFSRLSDGNNSLLISPSSREPGGGENAGRQKDGMNEKSCSLHIVKYSKRCITLIVHFLNVRGGAGQYDLGYVGKWRGKTGGDKKGEMSLAKAKGCVWEFAKHLEE